MQTKVNVYFSHGWDSETHPELADRKAAIALAKSISPNVKNFTYEGNQVDGFEFYFTEIVTVEIDYSEGDSLNDFDEIQNAKPLIEGGEMTSARRVK